MMEGEEVSWMMEGEEVSWMMGEEAIMHLLPQALRHFKLVLGSAIRAVTLRATNLHRQ